ncbi:Fe-S cluster assembly protein SufD [Crenothrix polyspora]|uniref:FeS assembly protein SufD n=1 Tax=Crenothrix polyspora TaxID=360316 RepID=A0A1R4GYV9_9GAMM|nr:Fe-S cluster assembly protein SufD [Crenothrix polyspora]SJM89155.1 FeS assembly protein SufD [Crenothrix polyspora]
MNTAITSRYVAEYDALAPTLPGQSLLWLQQLRRNALAKFSANGFPSPREEEWRYTNVSAIEKKLFTPSLNQLSNQVDANWLKTQQLADAWSVVLINGYFSIEYSQLEGLPESIVIMSIADALVKKSPLVESYAGQAVNHQEHGFVAFNTAYFTDGVLVHVPAKQVLTKPIQLLHIVTQADAMATTRTVILVDELAEAQVIETFVGLDNSYLTDAVTEVFVGKAAYLTLTKMQIESEKAYHFGGTYVRQAKDARFTHHNFAFGGLLARCDIHTDLDQASECELNGLYLGVKRQHIDNHTRINHLKPHAISREMYKGVLDDRAKGVFQGRVIVAEDAQKTDSQMNNRNLLLSDDAEADTKPQLEIYADDVKCGHGVTVGQLDEKSIFYLQSRCVDEETARNMLTFAFANEMVDKIKIKSLHDKVLEQVLVRFPQEGVEKDWL